MKKLLVFALFFVLIMPTAAALDAKDYQENMVFSLSRGQILTVPLIVENNADTDITNIEFSASSDWITFNGAGSYNILMIYHNSEYILPVQVSVPNDAGFGKYIIDIYESEELFSKIDLDVTVASSVAVDMEETMDNLKESTDELTELKEMIEYLESEVEILTSKMDTEIRAFTENEELISQLQSEKSGLESEVSSLEEKLVEEQKNAEITGMIVSGSSVGLGIVMAIIVVFFLARKGFLRKLGFSRIRSAKHEEKTGEEKEKRKEAKKERRDFKYDFTKR